MKALSKESKLRNVEDETEIESIGRAIGARARWRIINLLKDGKSRSLSEIVKELKDWQFQVIQNHCKILAEEGVIDMWREGGRWMVKLKKIPHVYIEEVGDKNEDE